MPADTGTASPDEAPLQVRGRFLAEYRELMAIPRARRMAAVGLVSKFPINMFAVSVLLLIAPRYSYGTAGIAISAMLIANALTSPLRGRLVDRYPVRVILPLCLTGYLTGIVGLALSAAARTPWQVVLAFAALMGCSFPPVSILMRTYWGSIAREKSLVSAMSLEAVMMDLTLISGPLLAAWLSTTVSPVLPFVVGGALMTGAVALMLTLPPAQGRRRPEGSGHWLGPLRSAALRRVFGAILLFCLTLSAVEVALPLYAQEHRLTSYTGLYLGALSVGSMLGGLTLGARPGLLARNRRLPLLLVVFLVGAALLALAARASPLIVLLICPVTGIAIGSTFSALFMAGGDLAPKGYENEAQGWAGSLIQVGAAAGAAAGASLAAAYGSATVLALTPVSVALAIPLVWRGPTSPNRN
ncbi:MFS transporter [Streptomyces sp. NBC_00191]|uniref:MFS transporter n=1 Tax=Streptomyces sp. NBC_00191 TaxID=2975674 RepID=UPI00324EE6F7